jgi:hypothetical protein
MTLFTVHLRLLQWTGAEGAMVRLMALALPAVLL